MMPDRHEPEQPLSQLYVLRVWREAEGALWQAMLRPADGGPRLGFANLEQLAIFLLCLADRPAPAIPAEHPPGDND
jgi:hypothetical protein